MSLPSICSSSCLFTVVISWYTMYFMPSNSILLGSKPVASQANRQKCQTLVASYSATRFDIGVIKRTRPQIFIHFVHQLLHYCSSKNPPTLTILSLCYITFAYFCHCMDGLCQLAVQPVFDYNLQRIKETITNLKTLAIQW